jgi:transposase-like protein
MEEIETIDLPTQEDIREDLRSVFQASIRATIECLLEEEVRALVGAEKWERVGVSRKDVRNGSYLRTVLTSMGQLELNVPRTRGAGSAGEVLGRYRRRTDEIDAAIVSAYVSGVSTRKVGDLTEALTGKKVSRSTVSRITKSLEERVTALKNSPISEPITYLYLDATFVDIRWARKVENVASLVAYGIGQDGHRKLLGVSIGAAESEAAWSELLNALTSRGLTGVRLIISDAHPGIKAAARAYLPEAEQQRCTVHLTRNVTAKTPRRLQSRVAREVSSIFNADGHKAAKKALQDFKDGLGKELPEATLCLENGFGNATKFFAFPKAHWKRIRSTNGVERLNGEIKWRTRAVGAFPDRESALRLITAVAIEATEVWSDRRYLDMSLFDSQERAAA